MSESTGERILARMSGIRNPLWYLNYGVGGSVFESTNEATEEESIEAVRKWLDAYRGLDTTPDPGYTEDNNETTEV